MRHQKNEAEKRISTDKGILLRMNRSIQVESAFGVLKQDHGFGRFLAWRKPSNETRLFILATAFNIRKLCSRLADGRFGKALFEPKTAWNNLPRTTKPEQVCLPYTKITLSAWAGFAWTEKCNVRHSPGCPPKKKKGAAANMTWFCNSPNACWYIADYLQYVNILWTFGGASLPPTVTLTVKEATMGKIKLIVHECFAGKQNPEDVFTTVFCKALPLQRHSWNGGYWCCCRNPPSCL